MSAVLEILDPQFVAEALQTEQTVLVYFWAPWCGPCRLVAPSVQSIAEAYGDRLKVLKMEVDPNPKTVQQYKVEGVPALIVLRNGEILDRHEGAIPKAKIEDFLSPYLA